MSMDSLASELLDPFDDVLTALKFSLGVIGRIRYDQNEVSP